MPDGVQEIIFEGGAQEKEFYPPLRAADTPAPTVIIEDLIEDPDNSTERVILASAPAGRDNTQLSLTDDAGPGEPDPRSIPCSGSSLVVGRWYVIEGVDGQNETFKCVGKNATEARTQMPLNGSYVQGDKVRGLRLTVQYPAAAAADEDRYDDDRPGRIRWTYTVEGKQVLVSQQVRVVRDHAEEAFVGEAEMAIKEGWYEIVKQLPEHSDALRRVVRYAARRIHAMLLGANINPDRFMSGPSGCEVLIARSMMHIAETGYSPQSRDQDTFTEEMRQEFFVIWRRLVLGSPGKHTAELTRTDDQARSSNSRRLRNRVRRS